MILRNAPKRHGRWSSGTAYTPTRCRLSQCSLSGVHLTQYCGIVHLQTDGTPSDHMCGAYRVFCPNGGSRIVTEDQ